MTYFSGVYRRVLAAFGCIIAFSLVTLFTTGCGSGILDTSLGAATVGSLSGTLMGGASPISGATMTIYATGNADGSNGGYGVGHAMGASVLTDSNGKFYFPGPLTCPAGQFGYLVSAGGDPGGGTTNNVAVLVAALGRCEDLFTHSHIYINELSTVAAAYALGKFTGATVGSGASTVIGIGAPASNNAVTGCVANGTTCTTTAAAGLAHAFENAQNLVNPFLDNGANNTLDGNAAAEVPAQLINAIANSLVACVNSAGQTGTHPCGQLFLATSVGGTASTNTWDAMRNLAANPTLAGTGQTPSFLLNIAGPTTNVYSPTLATAPTDYSIAITYPKGTGASLGVQGLQYPEIGALDSDDIYYVGNEDKAAATKSNIASFSSNGDLLDFTLDDILFPKATDITVDALGNVYTLNDKGADAVLRWQSDEGIIGLLPTPIATSGSQPGVVSYAAVDAANNLWFTTTGTSSSNLFEVSPTGTVGVGQLLTSPASQSLAIDPNQNVWLGTYSTSDDAAAVVLENTGSVSAPIYSSSILAMADMPGVSPYGIAFVANTQPNQPYLAYYSFLNGSPGLAAVTPTTNGGTTVSSISSGSLVGTAVVDGAYYNSADGDGTVWTADHLGAKLVETTDTAGGGATDSLALSPCLIASTSATSCSKSFNKPFSTAVDSAGSVWVTDVGNGSVVEVIGAAAPTWPLLSLGKLGRP